MKDFVAALLGLWLAAPLIFLNARVSSRRADNSRFDRGPNWIQIGRLYLWWE